MLAYGQQPHSKPNSPSPGSEIPGEGLFSFCGLNHEIPDPLQDKASQKRPTCIFQDKPTDFPGQRAVPGILSAHEVESTPTLRPGHSRWRRSTNLGLRCSSQFEKLIGIRDGEVRGNQVNPDHGAFPYSMGPRSPHNDSVDDVESIRLSVEANG